MIKAHSIREASEQLQSNLITVLDGQPNAMVDAACQHVVATMNPLTVQAQLNENELNNAANALSRALVQLSGLLGSDADASADYQQLLKDEKQLLKFIAAK